MKEIFERRSIRKYTDAPVSDESVNELLEAAMAAPSASNQQPWEFVIINDKNIMDHIAEIHPHAQMIKDAQVAIAVCADLDRDKKNSGYWIQDCSAATENILLEAQYLGLGAVWLGIYPREDRVKGVKELLALPERVIPLSIVSIGYPAEEKEPSGRYDKSRVHKNRW
jgi:nitroreductase